MSTRLLHPSDPVFEALIVPYRSMTPRSAAILAGFLVALSLTIALRFVLLGAWPVLAFSVLEVPLLGLLLAINIRRARTSELILLDRLTLTVTRTDPAGRRQSLSLPAAWLQVNLEAGAGGSRLMLSSRGRGSEVGAFLHEPDRALLFEALRSAMHDSRNANFDNPQLRSD
nr:DUF2244 domain-containing protein [uncultured Rhodopila sp.]